MNPYDRTRILNQADNVLAASLTGVRQHVRAQQRQRRLVVVVVIVAIIVALLLFSNPAHAQGPIPTPGYIDALATQVASEKIATQQALAIAPGLSQSAANAAALEAQAAAARRQEAALAAQATQNALHRQQEAAQAQATSNAAAQQATAIARATSDALNTQATQSAMQATQQAAQLQARETQSAIDDKRRNQEAVSTQIAIGAQATAQAKAIDAANEEAAAARTRTLQNLAGGAVSMVILGATVFALAMLVRYFVVLWRYTAQPAVPPTAPLSAESEASQSVVDANSGHVTRLPVIVRHDANDELLQALRRQLYGTGYSDETTG